MSDWSFHFLSAIIDLWLQKIEALLPARPKIEIPAESEMVEEVNLDDYIATRREEGGSRGGQAYQEVNDFSLALSRSLSSSPSFHFLPSFSLLILTLLPHPIWGPLTSPTSTPISSIYRRTTTMMKDMDMAVPVFSAPVNRTNIAFVTA